MWFLFVLTWMWRMLTAINPANSFERALYCTRRRYPWQGVCDPLPISAKLAMDHVFYVAKSILPLLFLLIAKLPHMITLRRCCQRVGEVSRPARPPKSHRKAENSRGSSSGQMMNGHHGRTNGGVGMKGNTSAGGSGTGLKPPLGEWRGGEVRRFAFHPVRIV